MNESEHLRELRAVASAKFARYAGAVANQLGQRVYYAADLDQAHLNVTYWEEWKNRMDDPSNPSDLFNEAVTAACSKLLVGLPVDELRLLWLGTDSIDKVDHRYSPIGATELVGDLFREVEELALEEIKKEQSFGAGIFEDRFILPMISDVLGAVARRPDLDDNVRTLLANLISMMNALPADAPTEFITLELCHTVSIESSGGSRIYSLVVSPENLEVSLGGSEWTKETGSDSWSGARFAIEVDGRHQEVGDVDEMMQEMLEAAANPDYEISLYE